MFCCFSDSSDSGHSGESSQVCTRSQKQVGEGAPFWRSKYSEILALWLAHGEFNVHVKVLAPIDFRVDEPLVYTARWYMVCLKHNRKSKTFSNSSFVILSFHRRLYYHQGCHPIPMQTYVQEIWWKFVKAFLQLQSCKHLNLNRKVGILNSHDMRYPFNHNKCSLWWWICHSMQGREGFQKKSGNNLRL